MQIGDEEVLSLKQAAERLNLSPVTLSEQARKGVLKATMIGRSYAVTASEVERYRQEHLGQRTGFQNPTHPFHGKRGGGGRRRKGTDAGDEI
ncbi:MAG: helix-turn-helix domain-containing protein [Gemmatimonadaceae bacterium]